MNYNVVRLCDVLWIKIATVLSSCVLQNKLTENLFNPTKIYL